MGSKHIRNGLDTIMIPPKKKLRSSLEADDEDDNDNDGLATFTFNSTPFKEENFEAHEGDAVADAALRD